MHACNKIDRAEKSDPGVKELLGELTKRITERR
jgi:hypothetical protein